MRDMIINYLAMIVFIAMGIYVFGGYENMVVFTDGFLKPIILTSPITLSLGAIILIKEFRQNGDKRNG